MSRELEECVGVFKESEQKENVTSKEKVQREAKKKGLRKHGKI